MSIISNQESTTYVKTQIDWIFSNSCEKITCGSYPTVFSTHFGLYAAFENDYGQKRLQLPLQIFQKIA